MSASSELYALLSSASGVTAIVGSGAACRIYPDAIPLAAVLPAIVYSETVESFATIHGTVEGEDATINISCWASDVTVADTLTAAVKAALVAGGYAWASVTSVFNEETGDYGRNIVVEWF